MKTFLLALQFLTVLPVRIKSQINPCDYGKSLAFFPFIGMLLGFFLSLVSSVFAFLPQSVTAALVLAASSAITGGLHLDGFADTCDGLCGFRTKERALEIMRDSRIGAMGAMGVVLLLLFKYSSLANIPQEALWKWLVIMTTFSRWSQVFACFISGYAREEGKAGYFMEYADKKALFIASIFTLFVFLSLAKREGLLMLIAAIAAVFLYIKFIERRIGGMTGDTVGAVSEAAEALVLLGAYL